MCGICGIWAIGGSNHANLEQTARRMTNTMQHRGPDDHGLFLDEYRGVVLGHRRLAVVDTSPCGHQPMSSPSGRYVIDYNGEVYNHRALRRELEAVGFGFHGHSDTEVVLAAIEHWGLGGALRHFVGMFAIALWDRKDNCLLLARDQLGIKPLYYGWVNSTFVFASELKAVTEISNGSLIIDRDALVLYFRYGYIPTPYSIYRNIFKLPPGTWLRIDEAMARCPNTLNEWGSRLSVYWSSRHIAESAPAFATRLNDIEAVDTLDSLLRDAVAQQMEADVPSGAFLSGGVDSSTVVALMQHQAHRPVQTFSIGFNESAYDEACYARKVATHLGTDHQELYVTPQDALDVIPRLPDFYDEPFGDSSQIPTFLVSQLARRHVTVSLSGDGGDELFGGYTRYFVGASLWGLVQRTPTLPGRFASALMRVPSRGAWDSVFAALNSALPKRRRVSDAGRKVHRLADALADRNADAIYRRMVSFWPGGLVIGGSEPRIALDELPVLNDPLERMLWADLVSYLPDDVLVKLDRASMAVSLEARVPLLDRRVVEFALRTPITQKIRNGEGKWLLRQVLYRYVPSSLIERPKMGFAIPLDDWLRGPLRDWAEELLDERRLREQGFLDPSLVRLKWTEHLRGRHNWNFHLWSVLMFQAWLESIRSSRARASIGSC